MNTSATLAPRRWSQFSLRTMLIVVTLLAGCLGWVARERRISREELELARQLEKKNCYTVTDLDGFYTFPEYKPGYWRRLVWRVCGPRIRVLHADVEPIDDLSPFARLTELECLVIHDMPVKDLTPLAEMQSLVVLYARGGHFQSLAPLSRLQYLKILDIANTQVSDLRPLAALSNLWAFYAQHAPISDLTPLARHKNLQLVRVQGTKVSKAQVDALQKALPNCKIEHDRFPEDAEGADDD